MPVPMGLGWVAVGILSVRVPHSGYVAKNFPVKIKDKIVTFLLLKEKFIIFLTDLICPRSKLRFHPNEYQ